MKTSQLARRARGKKSVEKAIDEQCEPNTRSQAHIVDDNTIVFAGERYVRQSDNAQVPFNKISRDERRSVAEELRVAYEVLDVSLIQLHKVASSYCERTMGGAEINPTRNGSDDIVATDNPIGGYAMLPSVVNVLHATRMRVEATTQRIQTALDLL